LDFLLFVDFSALNWPSCNSVHERWCQLWQIPSQAPAASFSSTLRLHVEHTSPSSSLVSCSVPSPGMSSCSNYQCFFRLWCCGPTVQYVVLVCRNTCGVSKSVDARTFLANTFTTTPSLCTSCGALFFPSPSFFPTKLANLL